MPQMTYVLMQKSGMYEDAEIDVAAVLPTRGEAERLQGVYERQALAEPVAYWVAEVPAYSTAEEALGL